MKPAHALLASHALAMSGWRMWEFAVALVLAELYPSSLSLVAAYGLADDVVRVASGSALGRFVDRSERLRCATRLYLLQHGLVALSCASAAAAKLAAAGSWARAALALLTLAAGATAGAGAAGSSLSVEQDWVTALSAEEEEPGALALLNSRMRAVDLSCLLLAPLAASCLLQFVGLQLSVLLFLTYNLAAFLPETRLLAAAQRASPALQRPRAREAAAPADEAAPRPFALRSLLAPLQLYCCQCVAASMFALALLYLTVLSMGFLQTAYLHTRGTSDVVISAFRGAGALAGLSSTVVFPALARRMGLAPLAAAAVAFQLACLAGGALPCLVAQQPGRGALLALQGGVAASRLGLWLADLAINQLVQEGVAAEELGRVQGAQGSVCSALEMLSFVAGLVWHRPEQFRLLVAGSVAAVGGSFLLCLRFALAQRAGGVDALAAPLLGLEEEPESEDDTLQCTQR